MPYQRPRTPIGTRRERVTLLQKAETDDGMGGKTVTWPTLATTWVERYPLDMREKEAMAGGQVQASHSCHMNMRFRQDVFDGGTEMRILWLGKTLEIQTVDIDSARKDRLTLFCREVR